MIERGHLCFYCSDILGRAYALVPIGGMQREFCINCCKRLNGQEFMIEAK